MVIQLELATELARMLVPAGIAHLTNPEQAIFLKRPRVYRQSTYNDSDKPPRRDYSGPTSGEAYQWASNTLFAWVGRWDVELSRIHAKHYLAPVTVSNGDTLEFLGGFFTRTWYDTTPKQTTNMDAFGIRMNSFKVVDNTQWIYSKIDIRIHRR